MSDSDSLHHYYKHQHHLIERWYEGCLTRPDPELVHQLRLSIKKIRALDVLCRYLHPKGKSNEIDFDKDLKRLFKIAGQLRDTQVQVQMLAEFEEKEGQHFPEFLAWLTKREKKRIKRFNEKQRRSEKHHTNQLTVHEAGNILAHAGDEAIKESAGKALDGLYARAKELSAKPVTDENLHTMRTVTKQIRYIFNMVKHSYPGFEFDKVSVEELRETEAAAGHWHDCLVRVELLGKFIDRLPDNDKLTRLKYALLPGMFKAGLDEAYQNACSIGAKTFSG